MTRRVNVLSIPNLQPNKVRFRCPNCALLRHDVDAVHCKACGATLKIPNEDTD